MTTGASKSPLNDVQLSPLRLFSHEMSESESLAIRQLLMDYYTRQLHEEVEKVIAEKGYQREDFEAVPQKQWCS